MSTGLPPGGRRLVASFLSPPWIRSGPGPGLKDRANDPPETGTTTLRNAPRKRESRDEPGSGRAALRLSSPSGTRQPSAPGAPVPGADPCPGTTTRSTESGIQVREHREDAPVVVVGEGQVQLGEDAGRVLAHRLF